MKNLLSIVLTLTLTCVSCLSNNESPNPKNNIFNEWEWVSTTFDTRGNPITALDVDTTYYYQFTYDQRLIIKDINSMPVKEDSFDIVDNKPFNTILIKSSTLTLGYSIQKDTLRLWEPNSTFPRTDIFIKK